MLSSISSLLSMINLPTYITMVRIIMVPCVIVSMMMHAWFEATVFFSIAAISDVIDGALARFLNRVTVLGSILDPIADKMLLIASYVGLALLMPFMSFSIPWWFCAFVIISELILLFFSFYWGIMLKSVTIKPTRLGRMTGLAQILFIGWLFMCQYTGCEPIVLFYGLLWLIVCARLCSFMDYAISALVKGEVA